MPIFTDISIEAYHSAPALSKSKLADLDGKGPEFYFHRHIAKTIPHTDSDALRIGRVFDGMMDDEERERARWAEAPPADLGNRPSDRERFAKKPSPETVERCARWDEYLARNQGKEMVSGPDRALLTRMAVALRGNPHFARLWPLCQKQVTIRRDLLDFGVSLQSRPDGLCLEHGFAVDVKSIDDIDSIPRQTIGFSYGLQAAIGQWLLAQEGHPIEWYLAFVEKTERPRTRVFRIPEVALVAEWNRCKRLVAEVSRRMRENDWAEAHPEDIPVLELPAWQVKRLEAAAS